MDKLSSVWGLIKTLFLLFIITFRGFIPFYSSPFFQLGLCKVRGLFWSGIYTYGRSWHSPNLTLWHLSHGRNPSHFALSLQQSKQAITLGPVYLLSKIYSCRKTPPQNATHTWGWNGLWCSFRTTDSTCNDAQWTRFYLCTFLICHSMDMVFSSEKSHNFVNLPAQLTTIFVRLETRRKFSMSSLGSEAFKRIKTSTSVF